MPKKNGGRHSPYPSQTPPQRERTPSPVDTRGWIPRSPTAGETAPSPSHNHTYSDAHPLDLHVGGGEPQYYPLEVAHGFDEERIVQVHIPEVRHDLQRPTPIHHHHQPHYPSRLIVYNGE